MLIERRRSVRIEPPGAQAVRVELRHRVQLLDISQSGTLIACEVPLPVGSSGRLRVSLITEPFDAELQIRREHPVADLKRQTGLGARFGAMDDGSRKSLEQFLRRASEEA